ncbi:MAG: hypothetical protein AAB675_00585 [Patescibacteria group bacterium]
MTQNLENGTRPSEWAQLYARLKSLPVLIYDGSEPVSGLATVENENVPPQTKRIIKLAGHSVTGETKVKKITYINYSSGRHVDISVRWENDHRTHKYHEPNIHGVRLMMLNGSDQFKPFAIVKSGGEHHVSEDYNPPLYPEEFDKTKEFLGRFQLLSSSTRAAFVMEIIDAIREFPHKMPWNPADENLSKEK